jgi:hypothetical protein
MFSAIIMDERVNRERMIEPVVHAMQDCLERMILNDESLQARKCFKINFPAAKITLDLEAKFREMERNHLFEKGHIFKMRFALDDSTGSFSLDTTGGMFVRFISWPCLEFAD